MLLGADTGIVCDDRLRWQNVEEAKMQPSKCSLRLQGAPRSLLIPRLAWGCSIAHRAGNDNARLQPATRLNAADSREVRRAGVP
jgi:hypothetical protein